MTEKVKYYIEVEDKGYRTHISLMSIYSFWLRWYSEENYDLIITLEDTREFVIKDQKRASKMLATLRQHAYIFHNEDEDYTDYKPEF
jgi:hypothetical protein